MRFDIDTIADNLMYSEGELRAKRIAEIQRWPSRKWSIAGPTSGASSANGAMLTTR